MSLRTLRGALALLILIPALMITSCGKKEGDSAATSDSASAVTGGGDMAAANVALSREFIDKVLNANDTAFAREHIDAAFVEHNPSPGQGAGVDGFFQWLAEHHAAFPDSKITIEDIFGHGDMVVIRSKMTGTNTGPMMGKPGTGKSIEVEVIDIVKIKDGKMTDHWGQIDAMKMMTDLGLMPPMDAASAGAPAGGDSKAPAGDEAKKDTAG